MSQDQHEFRSTSRLPAITAFSKGTLNVPPTFPPRRRSSLESAFSELSELSMLSHEPHGPALTREFSNTSNTSKFSMTSTYSARSRKSLVRQRLHRLLDENYGALLVLCSQLFSASMNILTRLLEHDGPYGPSMHPFQILFVRQSLTVLLCAIYAVTTKAIPYYPLGPPDRKVRMLLVCRGLSGFFGVFGFFYSLLYMPLSEATVLTFLYPILTCYLCSYIIPGETFTRQQQLAGFLSLIGVVFIAQPASFFTSSTSTTVPSSTDIGVNNESIVSAAMNLTATGAESASQYNESPPTPAQHLSAIAMAMVGVLGATGAITSIRLIGTRAHAFISINYFSSWSAIVCLVALLVIPGVNLRLPANPTQWGFLFALGICGFVAQTFLTMGLAYKATGRGGGSGQPKVDKHHAQQETQVGHIQNNSSPKPLTEIDDIEMQTRDLNSVGELATASSAYPAANVSPRRHGSLKEIRGKARSGRTITPSRKGSSSGTKATSMIYTQMIFALAGDRVVFGVTPRFWSWVGSGLILAGAIWVATATTKPAMSDSSKLDPTDEPLNDDIDKVRESESLGLLQDHDGHDHVNDSDNNGDEDRNDSIKVEVIK